jgi:monoamine oxidase
MTAPAGGTERHWAGTETAETWNGYMDGAVSSGEAARKVMETSGTRRRARA